MIAEAVLGNAERAFEYYRKIAPAYLDEISEVHRLEPYALIALKDTIRPGEAKNSWLTGTAAWNFVAASRYLRGGGLEPGIPKEISEFTTHNNVMPTDQTGQPFFGDLRAESPKAFRPLVPKSGDVNVG